MSMMVVALIGTVLLVLVVVLISNYVFLDRYADLERQTVQDKVDRTVRALALTTENLERVIVDWAVWDAPYDFMETRDQAFVEENLTLGALKAINVDAMAFIDTQGSVSALATQDGNVVWGADLLLSGTINATGAELVELAGTGTVAGLAESATGPILVALHPIVRSDESGDPRGVLLVTSAVDRETLDSIAALTGALINSYPPRDPGLSDSYPWLEAELDWGENTLVHPLEGGAIGGFVGFRDVFGDPVLVLEVRQDRQEYRQAYVAVWVFGSSIVAIWLAAVAMAWFLVRRLDISRGKLERSERRHRAVVEQSNEGMLLVDRETGTILEANPAFSRLSGYSPEEATGLALAAVLDDPEKLVPASEEQEGRVLFRDHRTRCRRKDGDEVEVEVSVSVIQQDSGEALSLAVRDITERIQAQKDLRRKEEELQRVQKMEAVGSLAGGVAHDFNNILSAIIMGSDLLRSRLDPNDTVSSTELLEMRAAAERGADLSRQLLAFGRRQRLSPAPLDLNGVVEGLARMLRRVIGERIELVLDLDSSIGLVEADQGQMEQVLLNLVLNARDAMPEGGKLTLATHDLMLIGPQNGSRGKGIAAELKPGRYTVVVVSDTGYGMDKVTAERIFEPFFTTKALGKGTGLGLAVVYGIVKQSGGAVELSTSPGEGSEFRVVLPCLVEGVKATPVEAKPVAEGKASPEGKAHILVIEDETTVRKFVVRVLRQAGYEVLEAGNGAEAFELLATREEPIDLLLSDMVMPGMSGIEVATGMRERQSGLPVVIMSGYSRQDTMETADHHPVVFIQKPFRREVLLSTIEGLLP